MKNKRGDIPITILVIGVVAVCFLTIFIFLNSENKKKENFVGPGLIETIYSMQEEDLTSFKKGDVEIVFEGDKIVAKYSDLILIEYTPK